MNSQKIGVFLSSHSDVPEAFRQATVGVGQWLGERGHTLVYGGSRYGMMEELAQSARAAGARVYGVVPQIVSERGFVSDCIDVEFRTADLHDRKQVLEREAEVFVALPGGIGTLDEVFTILGQVSIGITQKWVVLYNADGCWEKLVALLDALVEQRLVSPQQLAHLLVVDSIAALDAAVEAIAVGQTPEGSSWKA